MITLLLILLFTYVTVSYFRHLFHSSRYPPGPFPFPIIGNLNLLERDIHRKFYKLAKIYGNVFTFSMGMRRYVIVNGIEAARDALINKGSTFAGRDTSNFAFDYLTNGFNDIVFSDYGQYWMSSRKLAHSALQFYGEGKNRIEPNVVKQYKKLYKILSEQLNKPVNLPGELGVVVINVICSKTFNRNYQTGDPELQNIIRWADYIGKAFASKDIFALGHLPILRVFPLNCINNLTKAKEIRDPLLLEIISEHERTFDSQNIRDITDSLINENKRREEDKLGHNKPLTREQMVALIQDVVVAGFEPTWKTLHWCVVYLLRWPKYQEMIYNELIDVLGSKRYPSLNDRHDLPFVQAVIQETLRMSSVAYLAIPHKAIQDGFIDEKPVPKETAMIFNIWGINNDENEWEKPEEFNPYRWIDENGNYDAKRHRSFLTFSAGKRACMGESIARMELFLLISYLVRDFQILPNPEKPFPKMTAKADLLLCPHDFDVILNMRD